jgi:hypothetical protein
MNINRKTMRAQSEKSWRQSMKKNQLPSSTSDEQGSPDICPSVSAGGQETINAF